MVSNNNSPEQSHEPLDVILVGSDADIACTGLSEERVKRLLIFMPRFGI